MTSGFSVKRPIAVLQALHSRPRRWPSWCEWSIESHFRVRPLFAALDSGLAQIGAHAALPRVLRVELLLGEAEGP
jgi:hypothetical protein